MERKNSLNGLFIMLGLIAIAISIFGAFKSMSNFSRTVTVKGLCEKEVVADQVIWPIVYKVGGNNLNEIYKSVTQKNKVIIDWLTKSGITGDEISITTPRIEDLSTNQYSSERRTFDYIVTSIITVCSNQVMLVKDLMVEQFSLLDSGIAIGTGSQWEYPVQFSYNALNEIKPQMIEEATKNARQAAEKFAEDSDSELGKIRSASQGQFSVSDRDSNTPHIKVVRVVTTVNYTLQD